jgi:hypothetical protein
MSRVCEGAPGGHWFLYLKISYFAGA